MCGQCQRECREIGGKCQYVLDPEFEETPENLARYSGLDKFWRLFMQAINISPLDGDQMPSISMLPQIMDSVDIDMDKDVFWTCAEMSLLRLRERVRDERKAEIEKIKRK